MLTASVPGERRYFYLQSLEFGAPEIKTDEVGELGTLSSGAGDSALGQVAPDVYSDPSGPECISGPGSVPSALQTVSH